MKTVAKREFLPGGAPAPNLEYPKVIARVTYPPLPERVAKLEREIAELRKEFAKHARDMKALVAELRDELLGGR